MEALLKGGKRFPPVNQVWNGGRMRITGRKLEFYRIKEGKEFPSFSLSLKDKIDIYRILSCL